MSLDEEGAAESLRHDVPVEVGSALVMPSRLRPQRSKIFARVAHLTKIDGISDVGLEVLNAWYQLEWRVIHACRFAIDTEVTKSLKAYLTSRTAVNITAEEVEYYLNALCLLYYGLRQDEGDEKDVSKNKFFQRYYYMARENASALNSSVVMSNFLWACHKYTQDEFANTCLIDILLQAFPAALDLFIRLGGVVYLRNTLEYMAINKTLRSGSNYLLKALALLNKLDISFKTLQTSRIGIPVNGIATAGKNTKLGIDYECDNDNVKLKATDLIKKWKAIRDTSQVGRSEVLSRRILRKQQIGQQMVKANQSPQRNMPAVSDVTRVAGKHSHDQPSSSGSFVLNILDSMVEQREKERKRRHAMKEAQRNSLFKVTKSVESVTTPRNDNNAVSSLSSETSSTNTATVADSSPHTDVTKKPEPLPDSRKELQSLMDFFKTFKPQTPASQFPKSQVPTSSFPCTGVKQPSSFQSLPARHDLTGLCFPGNNISHMNHVGSGAVPTFPAAPSAAPPNLLFRMPTFMGGNGMNIPNLPPWR